jgi:hypothetical protein
VLPWQPDYWPVYHHGTFWVMGILHVISGLEIDRIHSFLSFYLISACFIFVCGMTIQKSKSSLFFIPSIFGLILWGVPTIPLNPGFLSHLLDWPTFNTVVSISGTGAASIQGSANTIFTIFSISSFLLFIYILINRNQNNLLFNYLILVILIDLNLSINESFLPIQLF